MDHEDFRTALEELGISQRWFAQHVGVDPQTVNRWATDKLVVPHYVEIIIGSLREKRDAGN